MIEEIENNVFDFEDDSKDFDIKIKPNCYIHMALLSAQKTLMYSVAKTSVGDGLVAYSIFIEQIEVLSKAADYLSEDYDTEVTEYKESEAYLGIKREEVKMARLANKKLYLLMKQIFHSAPTEFAIKDRRKKET